MPFRPCSFLFLFFRRILCDNACFSVDVFDIAFSLSGLKPPAKIGAPGSFKASSDRNAAGKLDKGAGAAAEGVPLAADEKTTAVIGMDPLGIAGVPMSLGLQQGADADLAASGGGEGDGEKASPSKVCQRLVG